MKSVTPQTLKTWLDHGDALLVDVREPAEHSHERIVGAHLLPLGQVAKQTLPDSEGRLLVIHCQKGGRSRSAIEKLLRENPALDLYNLEGGLAAWSEAGLPTQKAPAGFHLSVDRQTQLTIGLALLTTAVMTAFVSPYFIWLAVVFGLGLTVAGLTGFCGLARLMAIMPWNRKPQPTA